MPRLDMLERCAREKVGFDGWSVNLFRCMPPETSETLYYHLEGAVCPVRKSGPRKGQANWPKRDKSTQHTVIVTPAEYEAWELAWIERTGGCAMCGGTGRLFVRWSKGEGTTWRPCNICDGTGNITPEPSLQANEEKHQ